MQIERGTLELQGTRVSTGYYPPLNDNVFSTAKKEHFEGFLVCPKKRRVQLAAFPNADGQWTRFALCVLHFLF